MHAALPRIRFLQTPTSEAWVEQALANLDTILLDHAHCERKAASVAVSLMCRYPAATQLVDQLTLIAQEELTHYAQVNQILADRGIARSALQPPPYGATLNQQIRRQEPDRRLDSLLVAGLIEARSHERLGLLAAHLPDRELADFYRSLMASEARHYGVYWVLADELADRAVLTRRLEELAAVESEILATLHPQPRIHS
jgi:tRNA 2-(methylsulfanyl)-N6-isopentenyladenosine37 hydroxylase